MKNSDRTRAHLAAVDEMIRHTRDTNGQHGIAGPFDANLAVLRARRDMLAAEARYYETVESYRGHMSGLVRPGRAGEPFTAADLAGWQPPASESPESESRHDG